MDVSFQHHLRQHLGLLCCVMILFGTAAKTIPSRRQGTSRRSTKRQYNSASFDNLFCQCLQCASEVLRACFRNMFSILSTIVYGWVAYTHHATSCACLRFFCAELADGRQVLMFEAFCYSCSGHVCAEWDVIACFPFAFQFQRSNRLRPEIAMLQS